MMNESGMTIGRLARAANVGIETIRYYQRCALLPTPDTRDSSFRIYPHETINRIYFIKRAQELGFSLDEVATFLRLDDGADRKAIRRVAVDRLTEIRLKIADLQRMEDVLSRLVSECEATGRANPCPIIAALGEKKSKKGYGCD
jgi:Hg(II)-responsive transcriptional regulator